MPGARLRELDQSGGVRGGQVLLPRTRSRNPRSRNQDAAEIEVPRSRNHPNQEATEGAGGSLRRFKVRMEREGEGDGERGRETVRERGERKSK